MLGVVHTAMNPAKPRMISTMISLYYNVYDELILPEVINWLSKKAK